MNRRFLSVAMLTSAIAFAAAAEKGSGSAQAAKPVPAPINEAPKVTPITETAPAPAAATTNGASAPAAATTNEADTKAQPTVKTTAIRADIPMPSKKSGTRGGQTLYDFDKLEVGQSFGVLEKTAKAVASTVASANKRYVEQVKDQSGNVIMIPNPKKPGETKAMTKVVKKFVSQAVDPKTDPDGASVRVWRAA